MRGLITKLKNHWIRRFWNAGIQALMKGDFLKGVRNMKRVLLLSPRFTPAMLNLGSAYLAMHDWQQAKTYFEKVVKIDPKNDEAQYGLGTLAVLRGAAESAGRAFGKAISLNNLHVPARVNLGRYHLEKGDAPAALEQFDRALELSKEAHHLAELRGDDALEAYRLLNVQGDGSEVYWGKGEALMALNRYREALTCFDEGLALNADHQEMLLSRSQAVRTLSEQAKQDEP